MTKLKMTAKRHWFIRVTSSSEESTRSDEISWTISDSEHDDEVENLPPLKKQKVSDSDISRKSSNLWIILPQNLSPSKHDPTVHNNEGHDIDISSETVIESPSLNVLKLEGLSSVLTYSREQSPVISGIREESPVITSIRVQSPVITAPREQSPVINRRDVIRKLKFQQETKTLQKLTEIIHNCSDSTDIHSSKSCYVITDDNSDSEGSLDKESPMKISQCKSEVCSTSSLQTQNIVETVSDSTISPPTDPRLLLYHQPPPRRKHFKKGGLARQLQKALKFQRTSLGIWQHEQYLNEEKGDELQIHDDVDTVTFSVKNMWEEYGNVILECENLDLSHSKFLIVIGTNTTPTVIFEVNLLYKVLPPYNIKTVKYKQKDMLCFYNSYKFKLLE